MEDVARHAGVAIGTVSNVLDLALCAQPSVNVADEEPELTPNVHSTRALARHPPVVQRPHGHVEVLGEFLDAQQRL
jgi:hypothetical protein